MTVSCMIVDDEPLAVDLLTKLVAKTPFLRLAASFTDSVQALEYLRNNSVDLVFLDIGMPDVDGIDFLKIMNNKSKYILTTAQDHGIASYEFNVIDYLLKPITFDRFWKAAEKCLATTKAIPPADRLEIFVKTEIKGKLQKILINEICYIEGEKNYVSIHTDTDRIVTLLNLKDLEEKLPRDRFIRVNKSYIVALEKINSIEREQVIIKKPVRTVPIPLGITYKENLFTALNDRIIVRKNASQVAEDKG